MPKTKIVAAFVAHDATLEFGAESAPAVKAPQLKPQTGRRTSLVAAAVVVLSTIGGAAYWRAGLTRLAVPQSGSLRIETDPAGAEVRIDGSVRGLSPLALAMPPGTHVVTVQHNGNTKQLPVDVAVGAVTVHHITWTDTPAAAAVEFGSLTVSTDSPGGQVT